VATSAVLNLFRDHLPAKPYCTDDLAAGLRVLPLKTALGKAYIQHNGPGMGRHRTQQNQAIHQTGPATTRQKGALRLIRYWVNWASE
jgi:hypothetical protein